MINVYDVTIPYENKLQIGTIPGWWLKQPFEKYARQK